MALTLCPATLAQAAPCPMAHVGSTSKAPKTKAGMGKISSLKTFAAAQHRHRPPHTPFGLLLSRRSLPASGCSTSTTQVGAGRKMEMRRDYIALRTNMLTASDSYDENCQWTWCARQTMKESEVLVPQPTSTQLSLPALPYGGPRALGPGCTAKTGFLFIYCFWGHQVSNSQGDGRSSGPDVPVCPDRFRMTTA